MDTTWKEVIWRQFGAAIDMLENARGACPDELWAGRLWSIPAEQPASSEFWYILYHALFWLDLYLSASAEGFTPPAPFTLDELDPAGLLPERVYTRDELGAYLEYARVKCQARLQALTDEKAPQRCRLDWPDMTVGELLLYNMRHVQEHAAQLNLYLGQKTGAAPGWVGRAQVGP